MAIGDLTSTPVVTSAVAYDVVGGRDGRWPLFRSGCTREEAQLELEAAQLGGPSATWRLVRRTTAVTEELLPRGEEQAHNDPR
ncbi:hypothetical protein [Kineococcus rhizosphaerae]|uniref:hypothetical protein n=1 Tax=Kineococcus rhizosphaerae TaxID=559628 RepID=UPI000D060D59|nr:hypothetical protein [Kineococcus rhizosphaerae]